MKKKERQRQEMGIYVCGLILLGIVAFCLLVSHFLHVDFSLSPCSKLHYLKVEIINLRILPYRSIQIYYTTFFHFRKTQKANSKEFAFCIISFSAILFQFI